VITSAGVDHCYYISQADRRTWFSARQACKQRSGDLARIYNEEIRRTLKDHYLTDTKYWIGLVGLVWYWANGKTISNVDNIHVFHTVNSTMFLPFAPQAEFDSF